MSASDKKQEPTGGKRGAPAGAPADPGSGPGNFIRELIARDQETGRYQELVPISAQTGDNVGRLARAIAERLPPGPELFPEEMVTDRAERFLAAELVREQLFRQLGKEVPYATAVVVESFEERAHNALAAQANVLNPAEVIETEIVHL